MTEKQLYKFALAGIAVELEKLEKEIKQGKKLLAQIDNGEKVNTKKTKFEILDIVNKKKEQFEQLEKEKNAIAWHIDVELENEE